MKTCSVEGCNNKVWSKGVCLRHSPKTALKKSSKPIKKGGFINKISAKGLIKKEEKKAWLEELHQWEMKLWDKLEDENGYIYCYETGKPMHRSIYRQNLCVYSHCYPKNNHKDIAMKEWNLLIVLPDVHTLWESNHEKTPKMLAYFNKIKEKYGK